MVKKRRTVTADPSHLGVKRFVDIFMRVCKWLVLVGMAICLLLVVRSYFSSSWRGIETYRLLWYAANEKNDVVDLRLYQYLPKEQALVLYRIPADSYIRVAEGYGDYQVRSILRLANQEKRSDDLLLESVEETFGYEVRDLVKGSLREENGLGWEVFWKSIVNMWNVSGDVNGYDLFRVWWGVRNVSGGKIYEVDLGEQHIFDEAEDVDGVVKRYMNQLMLDDLINRTVPPAHDEYFGTQVVLVNTTSTPGLAGQMGRLITHEGFDVVRVMDEAGSLTLNEVWFSSEEVKNSLSGQRLLQLVDSLVVKVQDTSVYRADVVIFLGQKKGGS